MKQRKRWGMSILAALLMVMVMSIPAMAATQLGEPEEAYWDGSQMGIARWKKVDNAKEYEVRLYEGDDQRVARVTVSATKVDLSSYMTDGRWYHFSVRAVPKSNQKKVLAGEWVDSEMIEAAGLGDTTGKWRTYSDGKKYQKSDETYAADEWYKIQAKWYRFDKDGFMLTGWQQVDSAWYYMDAEGVMQTGWMEIDGNRYYFESSGAMAVGWKEDKPGEWYYLDTDGKMLTNTVVEGHQLDETGKQIS